jgi:hypothetical protein
MAWSEVNQQWYCNKCEIFHQAGPVAKKSTTDHLKEEFDGLLGSKNSKQPKPVYCPGCHTPLNWVAQYQRWYCYTCNRYV